MELEAARAFGRMLSLAIELPDQCWIWTGAKSNFGHGRMKVGKKLLSPHRLAYEVFVRDLNEGEMVCHHCDNPSCVNPRHLFAGSNSDNMKDAAAKGRLRQQTDPSYLQGENRKTAKLNDEKVREIRRSAGVVSVKDLAAKFGVHRCVIQNVIKRTRWKHVTEAA